MNMATEEDIIGKILRDLRVELSEEWDRNFERKAFFSRPWKSRVCEGRGSLMMQTGRLRRSLKVKVTGNAVIWSSTEPYAAIHNDGGTITVTAKMKRYFWAKYYTLTGKIHHRKDGSTAKRSMRVSREAEYYRNLALMKAGSRITIPKRQFIGDAPEVKTCVERVCGNRMKDVETMLLSALKNGTINKS